MTYDDAVRIARGCHDYGGGYRHDDALFKAYQRGIETVVTALTAAAGKDRSSLDYQHKVLLRIGEDAERVGRDGGAGISWSLRDGIATLDAD